VAASFLFMIYQLFIYLR